MNWHFITNLPYCCILLIVVWPIRWSIFISKESLSDMFTFVENKFVHFHSFVFTSTDVSYSLSKYEWNCWNSFYCQYFVCNFPFQKWITIDTNTVFDWIYFFFILHDKKKCGINLWYCVIRWLYIVARRKLVATMIFWLDCVWSRRIEADDQHNHFYWFAKTATMFESTVMLALMYTWHPYSEKKRKPFVIKSIMWHLYLCTHSSIRCFRYLPYIVFALCMVACCALSAVLLVFAAI